MSLAELEKEVLTLPERERELLIASLVKSLSVSDLQTGPTDDEVLRRDSDLNDGRVSELSEDAFVRAIERERRG